MYYARITCVEGLKYLSKFDNQYDLHLENELPSQDAITGLSNILIRENEVKDSRTSLRTSSQIKISKTGGCFWGAKATKQPEKFVQSVQ